MNCAMCGRALKDPASIEKGIGPICAANARAEMEGRESDHMEFSDHPLSKGVLLERTDRGVRTNVPWLIVDHSPDGYEWGYGGSGPADLALNIVEAYLRRLGLVGKSMGYRRPKWSIARAFILHQKFKREFIASMPKEGGFIPAHEIEVWIISNLAMDRWPEVQAAIGGWKGGK
jgi:hypothetical protein